MSKRPTTSISAVGGRVRDANVPLDLVDDPVRPSRETFDEDKMNELVASIRDAGLINPVSVVENNGRYTVLAGHRRLIACRALSHVTIRARIYPAGTTLSNVIQVHENAIREDLNAAEEANWWWELLERECGGDTNKLAELLRLSRDHVERRLNLKSGDPDVFSALGQSLISAGVAEELNRVKDPTRRVMYLDAAVRGGATRSIIRQWRQQGESFDALQTAAPVSAEATAEAAHPPIPARLQCDLCEQGVETGAIEMMYVHRHCRRSMIDRLLALYQEQRNQSNAVPPAP